MSESPLFDPELLEDELEDDEPRPNKPVTFDEKSAEIGLYCFIRKLDRLILTWNNLIYCFFTS